MSRSNDPSHWTNFRDFSALASGPLYFYVGAGLSQAAGLVGWGDLARILWHYLNGYEGLNKKKGWWSDFPKDNAKENARLLDGFVNKPFPGTRRPALSRGNPDSRVFGRVALLNMLLRLRRPQTDWNESGAQFDNSRSRERCGEQPLEEDLKLHSLIWKSNCHGVLTPNYDMLLEHAYSLFHHGAALRSYRYNAAFLRYIMSNPRFVLKLHGDINDVSTMLFDPQTAWDKGKPLSDRPQSSRGCDLREVYKTALESGHVVYVGMGFRDRTISELHTYGRVVKSTNTRVALIPKSESEGIGSIYRDIVFLTYEDREKRYAVRGFLNSIVRARTRHSGLQRPSSLSRPSEEATNIRDQLFLAKPGNSLARCWETEAWTIKGTRI